MDFGIGFLSNNVMLPILDFFYGLVPSYGLAIVALTLVVRFAVFPLSAGSIRNMRKTRAVQPIMQERQKEIRERYKDDPAKQQEELGKLMQELGNPLAGCLPVLFQMPILFALFATLRGSPFADINYTANVQVLPQEKMEQVVPKAFATKPQNVYFDEGVHAKVVAVLPGGSKLGVGETAHIEFKTLDDVSFEQVAADHPDTNLTPEWTVIKGDDKLQVDEKGNLVALAPGDATIQGKVPGLAANKGFLFIKALGRVGATGEDGGINWDIVAMVAAFGVSLYVSQKLTGQGAAANPQQDSVNKITPVLFSGMFLFFPLPAGVLMYMVIANIFQTVQTFFLMQEPLPENLQQLLDAQEKQANAANNRLAFEPKNPKKVEAKQADTSKGETKSATRKKPASKNTKKGNKKSTKN